MNRLSITETKSTPSVQFNSEQHRMELFGQSYPENAFKFYEPILQWVDEYVSGLAKDTSSVLVLRLPYINTSSTKCLMMLLEKLEDAFQEGKSVEVRWYCDPENESELECAEEFKEDLSLPFEIILEKDAEA